MLRNLIFIMSVCILGACTTVGSSPATAPKTTASQIIESQPTPLHQVTVEESAETADNATDITPYISGTDYLGLSSQVPLFQGVHPLKPHPLASSVAASSVAASSVAAPYSDERDATIRRVGEIEAIFQTLEHRRLQAILDHDEVAFRSVFTNAEYEERSVPGMYAVTVLDPEALVFTVLEVLVDEPSCIAVIATEDGSGAIKGVGVSEPADYVIEFGVGGWGFSWAGSGWRCNGQHPFSG